MNGTNGSREVTARIAALLTHYWTGDEHERLRQQQLHDWLEDLEEFGPEVVGEACKEYRRGVNHARRPLPGDIRDICLYLQADRRERRMIADARREASAEWPAWLADLWGPAPEGPRLRAEAIARDKARLRNHAV